MAASQVLQCWKDFNLRQLQQELDKTATELAAKEDESEAAKKRLVEQSREFRRSTADELRKVSAPLLKSLQTEIDQLLRRFKYAETAFLNVYKKVIDLPDPVEVLEHVQQLQRRAQRSSELELENNQLRDTLNEYNNEFAQVKNQEVTIKSLKEKVRSLEEEMESKVCNQLKERERQLERSFTEKEREIQDSNLNVARRLGEAERTIETLRSALSQAQSELFDVKSKYDERANAKSDEIEMLLAEVDRATEKAAAGEKEVEQLKAQLETLTQSLSQAEQKNTVPNVDQAMNALKNSSLEVELASKDREYQQLIEEYQRLQRTHARSKEEDNSRINRLEEELESAKEKIEQLEKRLSEQADYEDLKRELAVIKSIEFGAASERAKPLEVLVLEKNKQLQSELTQQKNANAELAGKLSQLENDYQDVSSTCQEQKHLIGQLEDDLRSVNAMSSMFRGDAEGSSAPASNTDVIVEVANNAVPDKEFDSTTDSLMHIVQSQRERFRLRAQELEVQNTALQQQAQAAQNETDKLRSDNLKLYEKIKFLQSYPAEKRSTVDETVSKYQVQYEEKLDPFSSFSKKEKMRKYMNLKPYERITLSMGRFIMGNSVARTVTFFYTLLLHLLVFLVLYKIAHTNECKRDLAAECHKSFADHMAKVHGDKNWLQPH